MREINCHFVALQLFQAPKVFSSKAQAAKILSVFGFIQS